MTITIPAGVNTDTLPTPYKKHHYKSKDAYLYILSSLLSRSINRKLDYETYFAMDSGILTELFGSRNYPVFINSLIDAGYIKEYSNPYTYTKNGEEYHCKGSFSIAKGRAKRYALNREAFNGYITTTTHTLRDRKLIEKINNARKKRTQKVLDHSETARVVYKSLQTISIVPEAYEFIKTEYKLQEIIKTGRKLYRIVGREKFDMLLNELLGTKNTHQLIKIFNSYGVTFYKRTSIGIVNEAGSYKDGEITLRQFREHLGNLHKYKLRRHHLKTLERIGNGETDLISMSMDSKTGRIFHNLTMTPRNIREFIRMEGQKLIEKDGSNAQWYLLHKLLSDLNQKNTQHINTKFHFIKREIDNTTNNTHTTTHQEGNPYLYVMYFFSKPKELNKELRKFKALLDTNKFREAFKIDGIPLTKTKIQLLQILFEDTNKPYYNQYKTVKKFKELFPHVHQAIKLLKTELIDTEYFGYAEKDRYKCLALILQGMEADIFVKGMEGCNGLFITMHDAIITNQRNEREVFIHLHQAAKGIIKLK